MEVFTIQNLNFAYPEQEKNAISDFSLSVRPGEFLVLCGPSGCGKSTLLRQLKTVLAPHGRRSGQILFDGKHLDKLSQREQAEKIGFVQQSPENQIVTDKVWHELAFGLESLGYDTPTIRRRVAEMASFFGIQEWFYKPVTELSGGQKQLLNLASVMAMNPKLLILDEPTSMLDPLAARSLLDTVERINRELGVAVLLTEHRLDAVFPVCDRVLVMYLGVVVEMGTKAQIYGHPAHPYTGALLSAVPEVTEAGMPDKPILEGEIPSPLNVPTGCRFHPRCPYATEQCRANCPELREVEPGHYTRCFRDSFGKE